MVSKETLNAMSNEITKATNTKYNAAWIGNSGGGNAWAQTGIYHNYNHIHNHIYNHC